MSLSSWENASIHLARMDRKPAACGIPRDAATIDAVADDGEVIARSHVPSSLGGP